MRPTEGVVVAYVEAVAGELRIVEVDQNPQRRVEPKLPQHIHGMEECWKVGVVDP